MTLFWQTNEVSFEHSKGKAVTYFDIWLRQFLTLPGVSGEWMKYE